jgi:FkbM family methyltransferase
MANNFLAAKKLFTQAYRRTIREIYFVKKFFLPANNRELFHCLVQYVEKDGLISKRILKKIFPRFPLDWPSHRKICAKKRLEEKFLNYCLENYERSNSQLFQDLLVLFFLEEKKGGYFVEFGATNGVDLSNSFQLEKRFAWQGILAEPARSWQSALKANRSCDLDFRCVWSITGELLEFSEADSAAFSTISQFSDRDMHSPARFKGKKYFVETISLDELLRVHTSPADIDYLSIDTEGSEFDILAKFDFHGKNIKIITVEHNYVNPSRENLHKLITNNGFIRIFADFSQFDDWYVNRQLINDECCFDANSTS